MHVALRTAGLLLAVAACGDDGSPTGADGGVDALEVCNEGAFYIEHPIAGVMPSGTLDEFRYMVAMRNDGFCGGTYQINFSPRPHSCAEEPLFTLWVRHPVPELPAPVAGDILPASASYQDPIQRDEYFEGVQFEVGAIDAPHLVGEGARIAGTFRASSEGWAFEIDVNTVVQFVGICL